MRSGRSLGRGEVVVFHTVVVGTDGSATASAAVREAASLVNEDGGTLHIVSSCRRSDRPTVEKFDGWEVVSVDRLDAVLEEATALARVQGVKVEVHGSRSDPANAIVRVAKEVEADVIVVGNKGMKGPKRYLLGSVPDKVAHAAPCTVLIVKTT